MTQMILVRARMIVGLGSGPAGSPFKYQAQAQPHGRPGLSESRAESPHCHSEFGASLSDCHAGIRTFRVKLRRARAMVTVRVRCGKRGP
jgi:hypothetical protein